MSGSENDTLPGPPGPPDVESARDASAKRRQILDGAREVFLRDGFDGASMNDITRAAGVSKGTLYVYFDSKEALFEALIRRDRQLQAEQMCRFDPDDHNIRAVLHRFGGSLMEMMSRPAQVAQVRTIMGITSKFPRIGQAFYESGPGHGVERLAGYLQRQGLASVATPELARRAAIEFINLCQGDITKRLFFGVADTVTSVEIDAHVARAVEIFATVYAVPADVQNGFHVASGVNFK